MRALEPKPQNRFSTAAKFRDALLEGAQSEVWSTEQCADFLRQDFAEREGRIEKLMAEIRLTDEPTIPMASKKLSSTEMEAIDLRRKSGRRRQSR